MKRAIYLSDDDIETIIDALCDKGDAADERDERDEADRCETLIASLLKQHDPV